MIDEKKLIDKEKLLRELGFVCAFLPCGIKSTEDELRKWIEKQPKISLENKTSEKWIPYDDEHEEPPMPDYYRVTVKGNIWRNNKFVFGKYTTIYYWDGTMFTDSIDDNGAVIAWLPNPEPYEEDE